MAIEIAAEPYPFRLIPEHCALLIIGMQHDFLEPGGVGEMLGNDVSQLRRNNELLDAPVLQERRSLPNVSLAPRIFGGRIRPVAGPKGDRPRGAARRQGACLWE